MGFGLGRSLGGFVMTVRWEVDSTGLIDVNRCLVDRATKSVVPSGLVICRSVVLYDLVIGSVVL